MPIIAAVVGAVVGFGLGGWGALGWKSFTKIAWGGALWGALSGAAAGYSIGSSVASSKPKVDFGNDLGSPKYGFTALDNTVSNELIFPRIYGKNKMAGNIIWHKSDGDILYMFIVLGDGEINSVTDVRVNDIPIGELPDCMYTVYYGTSAQNVDSRAGGEVKGLRFRAYLAVTLKTSDKLKGGRPTVTCDVEGIKVKTWTGSGWTSTKNYSNNPAACIRDILIAPRERGGGGFNEADFDDASFGEVYDQCAGTCDNGQGTPETRYTLNYVIDGSQRPLLDVLNDIRATCGIFLVVAGNKLKLRVEKQETPAMAFDMDNIKEGSFNYELLSKDDAPNIVRVQYVDPNQNDVKVEAVADDPIDIEDSGYEREKELSLLGINRYSQASRLANLNLYDGKLNNVLCSFTADIDALHCEQGDIVKVSHDVPNWVEKLFRIMAIEEEQQNLMRLFLRAYNSSIFDDSYGSAIVVYNYGSPPNPYAPVTDVTDLILDEIGWRNKDGTHIAHIEATWNAPVDDTIQYFDHYQIELKEEGGDYFFVGISDKTTHRISLNLQVGKTYYVKVKTVSINNTVSDGTESSAITLIGKDAPPSDVTVFAGAIDIDHINFTWEAISDIDLAGYEIRKGTSWALASVIETDIQGTSYNHFDDLNSGSQTFLIKAIDRSGNYSVIAKSAVVTINPPEDVSGFAVEAVRDHLHFSWDAVAEPDLGLRGYEIREGISWTSAQVLETDIPGMTFDLFGLTAGVKTYLIKAKDDQGNYSAVQTQVNITVILAGDVSGINLAETGWRQADGTHIANLDITWLAPTDTEFLASYEISYKKDTDDYKVTGNTTGLFYRLTNIEVGSTYYIKIRTVSVYGTLNAGVISSPLTTIGKDAAPGDVQTFLINQFRDRLIFSWVEVDEPDIAGYEIRRGLEWPTAALVQTELKGNNFISFDLRVGADQTYWIKAIDWSGNYSTNPKQTTIKIVEIPFKNVLKNWSEQTSWTGTKVNTQVAGNSLEITDPNLTGTYETLVRDNDYVGTFAVLLEVICTVGGEKRWDSDPLARFDDSTTMRFTGEEAFGVAIFQIRTSEDNVIWSDYKNYQAGDYYCRYFQIKMTLT
ncbi:MAG: phage tail protein, partial [Candidatus Margulisiibacteriota bacterium]